PLALGKRNPTRRQTDQSGSPPDPVSGFSPSTRSPHRTCSIGRGPEAVCTAAPATKHGAIHSAIFKTPSKPSRGPPAPSCLHTLPGARRPLWFPPRPRPPWPPSPPLHRRPTVVSPRLKPHLYWDRTGPPLPKQP